MNELALLATAPISKAAQIALSNGAINEILNGEVDPLKVDLHLKAMEETIKMVRGNNLVKHAVIEEAEKYGKTHKIDDVSITVSTRTDRDFSQCGDQFYNDAVAEMERLKAVIKAREAMLLTGVNPETGESYYPPQTKTSTFLTYKF